MKTIIKFLFVATLGVFVFSQGFSQENASGSTDKATTQAIAQGKFVDANKDGVCDNYQAKGKDNRCANFVDKDGNGVCDNCPGNSAGKKNANCQGNQYRHGCGQGPCHGKAPATCCPNKQMSKAATPSDKPDPKK
jgi:hypothetical protein